MVEQGKCRPLISKTELADIGRARFAVEVRWFSGWAWLGCSVPLAQCGVAWPCKACAPYFGKYMLCGTCVLAGYTLWARHVVNGEAGVAHGAHGRR